MIRMARSRALAVCEANEPVLRKAVLGFLRSELKGDGVTIQELEFTPEQRSLVSALKDWADGLKKGKEKIAVSVEGLGESLDIQWRKESLRILNQQRDFLLKFPHPVILWVNKETMERIPIEAADFWVVRTGYFRFLPFDVQFEQAIQELSSTSYLFESKEEIKQEIRRIKKVLKGADKKTSSAAALLHNLGIHYQSLGNFKEARRLYEESLKITKELSDKSGIASTLHQLGNIAYSKGDYGEARRLYGDSLEIEKELGDKSGIAITLHQLGMIAQDQGDYAEARKLYEESLGIKKKLGDKSGIAKTLHQLGNIAYGQGDYAEARKLYEQSLEIKKELGDKSGIAITLHQLGNIAYSKGDYGEARRLYEESLEIEKELGDKSGIAKTLHQLGMIAHDKGDYTEAHRLYGESLEIARELGDKLGIALSLGQLGRLAEEEGNELDTFINYLQALNIFTQLKAPEAKLAGSLIAEQRKRVGVKEFERIVRAAGKKMGQDLSFVLELFKGEEAESGDEPS